MPISSRQQHLGQRQQSHRTRSAQEHRFRWWSFTSRGIVRCRGCWGRRGGIRFVGEDEGIEWRVHAVKEIADGVGRCHCTMRIVEFGWFVEEVQK
jgi:hypothetical protein